MQPLNRYIDHAVLKPELTPKEAEDAIELGVRFKTRTVCVRPSDIEQAKALCRGSETDVCTVLAFPHGCGLPASKSQEAAQYAALGVREVDMVANIGLIRAEKWDAFREDIEAVITVLKAKNMLLKVILETALLSPPLIAHSTRVCADLGADFVKTSTGFNGGGATIETIKTMLEAADGKIRVKASGGIRTAEQARQYVKMGCDRLGVGFSTTPLLCGKTGDAVDSDY